VKKKFSCYVIGDDTLASQCGDILLSQGHLILGVISSLPTIQAWACKHKIPLISASSGLSDVGLKQCDYLFSIVNNQIFPERILALPKYFAINYHDAVLPRYAGVHATSWALLNQEKSHGVTWHIMEEKIDAGDILKQEIVNIDNDETALSLNLKCYQAAIKAFSELVDELATNTYVRKPQDLSQRTYYPINQKSMGNGWINWHDSAENIERYYRALNFGDYCNRLGSLKFKISGTTYIINELKVLKIKSAQPLAGTLVKHDTQGLRITTATKDIIITQVKSVAGNLEDIHTVAKRHKLVFGSCLFSPSRNMQASYQKISTSIFKHESFWVQQFRQLQPATLPFLALNHKKRHYNSSCLDTFSLSPTLQKSLKTCFPMEDNFKNILLTTCLVYLYRLNDQEKLSVGLRYPSLMQQKKWLDALVANFVPLTVQFEGKYTFKETLELVESQCHWLKEHGTYLEDIYVRYPELNNLYQPLPIGVVLEDAESASHTKKLLHQVTLSISKSAISLYAEHKQDKNFNIIFENIVGHLKNILKNVIDNPNEMISRIPLLTQKEQQKILIDWNKTQSDYPQDKTIPQLFEQQVRKTPNKIAIIYEKQQLSYAELNEKANQLARYLQKQGVKIGSLIAICVERSLEMIVGILGILKAGAAYVPIDSEWPESRIYYILEDIKANIAVTNSKYLKKFPNRVLLDKDQLYLSNELSNNLLTPVKSYHLAYVIYTSGTTGNPKGVLIKHQGVINMAFAKIRKFSITPDDKFLNFSTFSFDASVWEIFTSLMAGATLYLAKKNDIVPGQVLNNFLHIHKITIATLPPTILAVTPASQLHNLRAVISAGEICSEKIINQWCSNSRLFANAYGPTEATVCATVEVYHKFATPSIGKPIVNVKTYVLDSEKQPLPVGAMGELYVAGDGLADGYLNQPELTKEKFVTNPFSQQSNKLYKTGDLVRWLPDGNLEYIGRQDDQIKIRGFRIELGEIEAVLAKHPLIAQAIVCVRELDDRKQLEAYFITKNIKNDQLIDSVKLRNYLKQQLPDYMLPARFFEIKEFPLTFNGKIDKRMLLAEHDNFSHSIAAIKNPTSTLESSLVQVWSKVLKLNAVNVDDNFFALGGDSILAIQLVAKANDLGLQFAVKDIFQYPTIASLAKQVKKQVFGLNQVKFHQKFRLAPIQQWFFNLQLENPAQFSQSCLLTIKQPVNLPLLERCFQEMLQKHPALNLRFQHANGIWRQLYASYQQNKLIEVIDTKHCTSQRLSELVQEWTYKLQQNFNLTNGPLLKAVLFSGHSLDSAKLLIVIHHLVVDGVSWRILLEELQSSYQQLLETQIPKQIFTGSLSYHAWIKELLIYAKSPVLDAEESFWKSMDRETPLHVDQQTGPNLEKYTASVLAELTEQETAQLLQTLPARHAVKPHEVLIALLAKTLTTWLKSDGIVIDLESHGRQEFSNKLNLSRTVGWFTSLFPIYFTDIRPSVWDTVQSIKQQLQRIPHHGIGYGLWQYFKKMQFHGKADVAFNYWGQFDQTFADDSFKLESLQFVSHSENKRMHLLNIDGIVKDKKLQVIWTYSTHYHTADTIKYLANCYLDDLRTVLLTGNDAPVLSLENFSAVMQFQIKAHLQDVTNAQVVYPLSDLQKGLLFHTIYSPSEAYMVQLVWHSPDNSLLNLVHLQQAWRLLIARYDLLRTYFLWEGLDEPVQIVQKTVDLIWIVYDWSTINEHKLAERLETFLKADRQVGFNFKEAPLLKITILQLPQDRYVMIATLHHILLDGWSLPILLSDLEDIYRTVEQGQNISLPPTRSYKDFIQWLAQQDLDVAKNFWKYYLQGFSAPTELAMTHRYDREQQSGALDIAVAQLKLSGVLTKQITQFCRAKQLTTNTFFQGLWALLLNRYSQHDDVVFGVTMAVRPPDFDRMVGLLINTLPLRINLQNNVSAQDFLTQIQINSSQIAHYNYTPLSAIQEWTEVPVGTTLFNSILVFENYSASEQQNQLFKFSDVEIIDPTHYPLACIVVPGETIMIKLAYDKNQIDSQAIQRLQGHLQTLLIELLTKSEQTIHHLNILTSAERQQILVDWNSTETNYPWDKTVHQLFEDQVEKTPQNVAVVFEGQQLTYRELNNRANQLAHYLRKQGVKADSLVAVCLERSFEMVISLLGVLKAGGAYVPIDPEYPENSIQYMLLNSDPQLIISHSDLWYTFNNQLLDNKKTILINCLNFMNGDFSDNLYPVVHLDSPIYVIYTSGSTGEPKGVINTHQGILNRLLWMQSAYQLTQDDNLLQKTPFSFDVSVWEFLWPLMSGAKLVVAQPGGHRDDTYLKEIIINQNITVLHFVPSMLLEFLNRDDLSQCFFLKKIICSGEALNYSTQEKFYQKLPWVKLYNLYGPTEASIDVTAWDCSKKIPQKIIPIGKPISNIQIYILDRYLNLVPVGLIGELYIAGIGLAKGYLNRQKLTDERFINNPFDSFNGKVYKTGDLARWLPDGNIEYIGRNDDQVKIRGLRVELGEVEHGLLKYPGVKQAVVLVRNDKGSQVLVAYLEFEANQTVEADKIRASLKAIFPSYMIPAGFIAVDKLPLTPNGKIDRKSLAAMERDWLARDYASYVAPQTEVECQLEKIWVEILGIPKIGVKDNFFDLGGHSLLALQLIGKIKEQLKGDLSVRALFDAPTIAELAILLESQRQENAILQSATIKKYQHPDCLVSLQPKGDKTPLFLVHPVGGTVFWYTGLSKYLDSNRPLYGIQDPGVELETIPFQSMEEMASYYIKAIRTIQPQGPYILGGASAGGNISVEMARQLQEMGHSVAFAVLLDTWVPYPDALLNQEFFEANMRRQYHSMREKFSRKGLFQAEALLKLQWSRVQMYAQYQTPIVDHKLTLFKAVLTVPVYQSVEDQFNHWEYYSAQPIARYIVPGDHETMFQEPHVADLGQKLNSCLNELEVRCIMNAENCNV
jgi:amino acid adenylation domain-containing protein/non-ribosomal peptide synthase protein (TIGR01720 family)